ncbi:hypothetical protein [Bradyrhizobium sp.]|uniref:hypothetical protein n=1 Tax=Bradyrhizobium sp. TaxID=376 RepID=UPI002736AC8F|nr:hypothetical protein [Bradyrhizobium sp.]MDP3076768.1 hypothetical protein [Bradyrhizobium sp.]
MDRVPSGMLQAVMRCNRIVIATVASAARISHRPDADGGFHDRRIEPDAGPEHSFDIRGTWASGLPTRPFQEIRDALAVTDGAMKNGACKL